LSDKPSCCARATLACEQRGAHCVVRPKLRLVGARPSQSGRNANEKLVRRRPGKALPRPRVRGRRRGDKENLWRQPSVLPRTSSPSENG
jgi:hypothetical protein